MPFLFSFIAEGEPCLLFCSEKKQQESYNDISVIPRSLARSQTADYNQPSRYQLWWHITTSGQSASHTFSCCGPHHSKVTSKYYCIFPLLQMVSYKPRLPWLEKLRLDLLIHSVMWTLVQSFPMLLAPWCNKNCKKNDNLLQPTYCHWHKAQNSPLAATIIIPRLCLAVTSLLRASLLHVFITCQQEQQPTVSPVLNIMLAGAMKTWWDKWWCLQSWLLPGLLVFRLSLFILQQSYIGIERSEQYPSIFAVSCPYISKKYIVQKKLFPLKVSEVDWKQHYIQKWVLFSGLGVLCFLFFLLQTKPLQTSYNVSYMFILLSTCFWNH